MHPGAQFGTNLGGSWGGHRVPPCSCSTTSSHLNQQVYELLRRIQKQVYDNSFSAQLLVAIDIGWYRVVYYVDKDNGIAQ